MKYLIVVDMQNDFINMALGTKEAVAIVPDAVKRITQAKAEGYKILATQDTHYDNYLDTQEGKKLPVAHCIENTDGWKINDEIQQAMGSAIIFCKNTFGSTALVEALKNSEEDEPVEEIELIGLCTDICVVSNALLLKAAFTDTEISVNAKCCAGVTPETHNAALQTMKMCQITIK